MTKTIKLTNLTETFKRYSGWSGADGIYTFRYLDKVLWYFSDTFVGESNRETNKRIKYSFINNSLGVSTQKITDMDFIYPKDLTTPITPDGEGYYWLQDGVVIDGFLYIAGLHMINQLLDGLPFSIKGVDLIKYNLKDIGKFSYLVIQNDNLYKSGYIFGASIFDNRNEDGFIYVYGYKNVLRDKQLVVSRFKDNLETKAEYLSSNDEWIGEPLDLKILSHNFAAEFKVVKLKNNYCCAYTKDSIGADIYLVRMNNLTDEFQDEEKIYSCPEHKFKPNWIAYNAKIQEALSNDNYLIISYSVNTLVNSEHEDLNVYYPRFIKVEI